MTYPERFAAAGAALTDRPGDPVQEHYEDWHIAPPRASLTPTKLPKLARAALHELGLNSFPEDLRALYTRHDYVHVWWQRHDPAYGPALVRGYELLRRADQLFTPTSQAWVLEAGGLAEVWLWDREQSAFAGCSILSFLQNNTCIVWRLLGERVQLGLYLGGNRLHWLPFSPVEYMEAGLAFQFLELWQLLFLAEADQADYAEAIGTILGQVRHFCPGAEALVPAHVVMRFPVPGPVPAPNYRQLFRDTVAALRRVPNLSLYTTDDSILQVGDEPAPGVPLGTLEQVRRELGRPLPTQLRGFYQQLNGAAFFWHLPRLVGASLSSIPPEGGVRLWPLERVFGGPVANMLLHWDDSINDGSLWSVEHRQAIPALAGLRPFDGTDAEVFPSIRLPHNPTAEPELYLLGHPDTSGLTPLRLSFADYLITALAGAGVRGWQRHFLVDEDGISVLGDWVDALPLPVALRQAGLDADYRLPS